MPDERARPGALTAKETGAFLARHDLVYEAAPETWRDGIPLGNGTIGAVLWGDGAPLRITLDHCALWDLRSPRFRDKRYSFDHYKRLFRQGRISEISGIFDFRRQSIVPSRLPPVRLELACGRGPADYTARLKLASASAEGKVTSAAGAVRWRAFLAAEEDVLVLDILPGKHPRTRLRACTGHLSADARAQLKRRRFPLPRRGRNSLYQAIPKNGGYLVAWRRVAGARNSDTFLITLVKGKDRPSLLIEAARRLGRAVRNLRALRRAHVAWWRQFWRRSFLTVPDKRLQSMFYAEMYKLGCNQRENAPLPVALHGVWSPDGEMPPWHGDYHLDMNVQMTYWPVYASNRLECAMPLYRWAVRLLPVFRKYCREFFGGDGAFAPCAIGPNGERVYGYETVEQWPGNGAWLAHHFWLHYRHTRDLKFLRALAYPYMREFMRLYCGILEKEADGLYHIPLSTSPEYGEDRPEAWGRDTACDLTLVRFLAETLLECVAILGLDEPEAGQWRDVLRRLAPCPSRATMKPHRRRALEAALNHEDIVVDWPRITTSLPRALFIKEDTPYGFSHRHFTHLMGIYPLGLLALEDGPEVREMIEHSLFHVCRYGENAWAGHGTTWAAGLAAVAGRPEMAARLLREYTDHYTSANTFCMNTDFRRTGLSRYMGPVMTLETGWSLAAVLMDMLLQSRRGLLRIFPAIPCAWREASFCGLRAEGGFLVSARLAEGAVGWVRIESELGLPCTVVNPFGKTAVTLEDLKSGRQRRVSGSRITFPTAPGSAWLLYVERPGRADLKVPASGTCKGQDNPFGVKRGKQERLVPGH